MRVCVKGQAFEVSCGDGREHAVHRADIPAYSATLLSQLFSDRSNSKTRRTFSVELCGHVPGNQKHVVAHTSRSNSRP